MRREADNVGPKAELDHWKKRMAKFNSLLDELKAPKCKAVLGVMLVAKSKILKVFWFSVLCSFLYFCVCLYIASHYFKWSVLSSLRASM